MVVDIPDVVKYANFGDHRLRGFWVTGGQILPSPIDFHRRPYNTLALLCERVILASYDQPARQDLRNYTSLQAHNMLFNQVQTCTEAFGQCEIKLSGPATYLEHMIEWSLILNISNQLTG